MKFWLGFLAYLVPTFPIGYLWHLAVFHDAYSRLAVYRGDLIIPLGIGSMVIQGLLFSWAYPRLFSTRRRDWLASASRFGMVFAPLAWTYSTLAVAAKHHMASVPDFLMLESGFTLFHFAIVSPLIALAHRSSE